MHCPHCKKDGIRRSERCCPKCARDCGFPNVRQAEEPEERKALADQLAQATAEATARGCAVVLEDFREAVRSSKATINRSLSKLTALVDSDDTLFATFYDLINAGLKRPPEDEILKIRKIADELIFPGYEAEIRFAALSLVDNGAPSYGACAIVLDEDAIAHRATVFVENTAIFARKEGLGAGKPWVPKGARAVWAQRDELAASKLSGMLKVGTKNAEFQEILLWSDGKNPGKDTFLEVHIYGPLHRSGIEKVVVPKSQRRGNAALIMELKSKLEPLGVSVEE